LFAQYQSFDCSKFAGRKAVTSAKSNRIQPELRFAAVPFDMHVRRLVAVTGVEKEPIRSAAKDSRHLITIDPIPSPRNPICSNRNRHNFRSLADASQIATDRGQFALE